MAICEECEEEFTSRSIFDNICDACEEQLEADEDEDGEFEDDEDY